MTDNMENSGNGNGGGASQAQPSGTPQPSSAIDTSFVAAQLEKLNARLEQIERGSQSVKDKRIAGLQGDVDTFKAQLGELKDLMAGGLSETVALRLMANGQPHAQGQPVQVGNQQSAGSGIDVASVISAMELDANNPAVLQVLRSETDSVKLVASLTRIAQERKASKQQAIPAGQMMASPGESVATETKDSIAAELAELTTNPTKNIAKIRELSAKLKGMH